MDLFKKSNMEYRYLGNTGLQVSVLGFGNWVNTKDDVIEKTCIKKCLENGINFFDTAESYDFGQGELSLGKALKELEIPREKIVVTTKMNRIGKIDPNDGGQSRKHIVEGIKNSLKRLQLDYVDIIYSHRYDRNTPLEETCRAYNYVIEKGWALYWGTSEWTASQIMEAYKICEKYNLIKPIVEQCQYNMFFREKMENEYRDLFKKYKMGTSIWSPLLSGVLTGKYIKEMPNDSRLSGSKGGTSLYHLPVYEKNKKIWDEKLLKIKDIAENKLNCSLTQLAIAWVICNPDVSTCILGASKVEQLEESIKSVEIYKKLKEDKNILKEIEEILGSAPVGETDFLTFKVLPSRRNLLLGIDYYNEK